MPYYVRSVYRDDSHARPKKAWEEEVDVVKVERYHELKEINRCLSTAVVIF